MIDEPPEHAANNRLLARLQQCALPARRVESLEARVACCSLFVREKFAEARVHLLIRTIASQARARDGLEFIVITSEDTVLVRPGHDSQESPRDGLPFLCSF